MVEPIFISQSHPPQLAPSTGKSELWAVAYGSQIYRKLNWWTGFLFSKYLVPEKLRSGQNLLFGTGPLLPNTWTLVFQNIQDPKNCQQLKDTWSNLGSPPMKILIEDHSTRDMVSDFFKSEIMKKQIFLRDRIPQNA